MLNLSSQQTTIRDLPLTGMVAVTGPVGSGKTTAAVERLLSLLRQGISANSILVLTPQRTLAEPYAQALSVNPLPAGGKVSLMTVSGLARHVVQLFWPLAAEQAGFEHFDRPPIFLNLETAQYHMSHLVRPLLDEGYFGSVTIDRNRLYSQIIDNLNKAASVGFHYMEISSRLGAAWSGDPSQRKVFADVQDCADRFRKYCLKNNLVDYSLQMEIFRDVLWQQPLLQRYLSQTYRHLIYDNPEEDTPRAHDTILDWLKDFDSALILSDDGGGYRQFLGADVTSARRVIEACGQVLTLNSSFVMSPGISSLDQSFKKVLAAPGQTRNENQTTDLKLADLPTTFPSNLRFYPQMIDWVSNEIATLIHEDQVPPSQIVILAPFLSDSLRYSLVNRLEALKIPTRSHRPSRSLRDEPASQALLTLSALAHPSWNITPSVFDVTYTFFFCLQDMDLVRAQLLSNSVYDRKDLKLAGFEQVPAELQGRISYSLGGRYQQLRDWLDQYRQQAAQPFDHFLRRLFGEILSQPGFGFHNNFDGARVAASLIESVRNFRQVIDPFFLDLIGRNPDVGREYIQLLEEGVLAAQYLEAWLPVEQEAILIVPAYTFLMMNQPVEIQFWLDPGSSGWVERLYQPLTQPYVLSRSWLDATLAGTRLWTDADEVAANQQSLSRLVSGLLHRCKSKVYLGISNLGETGYEQRSLLLKAFQAVFQQAR